MNFHKVNTSVYLRAPSQLVLCPKATITLISNVTNLFCIFWTLYKWNSMCPFTFGFSFILWRSFSWGEPLGIKLKLNNYSFFVSSSHYINSLPRCKPSFSLNFSCLEYNSETFVLVLVLFRILSCFKLFSSSDMLINLSSSLIFILGDLFLLY